jgi:hypothetical protein
VGMHATAQQQEWKKHEQPAARNSTHPSEASAK